ncbi:uncharacterized protein LOC135812598 [Sycon ciliatum]|uniref:uncharacterized protein LOC135812598 n=1 Tax=Sycon ciliatum TaxID=27933 RepID=UPI0031F609EC
MKLPRCFLRLQSSYWLMLAVTTLLVTLLLSPGVVQRPREHSTATASPRNPSPQALQRTSISLGSVEHHSKEALQDLPVTAHASKYPLPKSQKPSNGEAIQANGRSDLAVDAGERWYRYGKPFHATSLADVSFVFKAADVKGTALLLYAQLLRGIFHSVHEQYVTVVLNASVVTVALKLNLAANERGDKVQMASTDQRIEANVWYSLCIVTAPVLRVYMQSVTKKNVHLTDAQLTKCGQSESSAEKPSKPVLVDSGLYFGGVIDWQACPGLTTLRNLQTFRGKILRKVYVNMQAIDLVTCTTGHTAETWREHMSKIDIKSPISIPSTRTLNTLEDLSVRHFPVLSAISSNHAVEIEDMIASVAQHMPRRGVIIYRLGLSKATIKSLSAYCNVTVRHFRQDIFKDLAENLRNFQWKPLLVYGAFLEFDGVIWADASVRFKHPIRTIPLVQHGVGFVGFEQEGASPIGAFTHDGMLKALGVERSAVVTAAIAVGTVSIWMWQGPVSQTLVQHWTACSMRKVCIAPRGAVIDYRKCRLRERKSGKYIGCHRYDQSALSVLAGKLFQYLNESQYIVNADPHVWIDRGPTRRFHRCKQP